MAYPDPNKPGYVYTHNGTDDIPLIRLPDVTTEMDERFSKIAQNYLDRYMEQCWIDDGEFKGWRWDKYGAKRMIAGVANRYGGIIVMGTRHYSNLMRMALDALGGSEVLIKWAGEENYDQGFVDQYGTFLDRKEAWVLAESTGQIRYRDGLPTGTLYSEHLW